MVLGSDGDTEGVVVNVAGLPKVAKSAEPPGGDERWAGQQSDICTLPAWPWTVGPRPLRSHIRTGPALRGVEDGSWG